MYIAQRCASWFICHAEHTSVALLAHRSSRPLPPHGQTATPFPSYVIAGLPMIRIRPRIACRLVILLGGVQTWRRPDRRRRKLHSGPGASDRTRVTMAAATHDSAASGEIQIIAADAVRQSGST